MAIYKKWVWITALQTSWSPPSKNEPWTNDAERNFTRLLQAPAYHINYGDNIDMTGDIYMIVSFDIGNLDKEIAFAKKVKAMGKKVVVCFSADFRFLIGNCLMNSQGRLYTDLCKEADLILSGIGDDVCIYGRYQDKVISWGLPMERLNFSIVDYSQRNIDILVSSTAGEESFAFNLELLYLIKERNPGIRIMYSLGSGHKEMIKPFMQDFEFVHEPLIKNLPFSKVYLNPEVRPRGGRALLEAFYCRTPFISCDMTFYSKLFPQYSYSRMNMVQIADTYQKIINSNYADIIKEAETRAEPYYFDNAYEVLMKRLFG